VLPELFRSCVWRRHPPDADMANEGTSPRIRWACSPRGYHNTYVYQKYLGWGSATSPRYARKASSRAVPTICTKMVRLGKVIVLNRAPVVD
jgi:hypothetical protein